MILSTTELRKNSTKRVIKMVNKSKDKIDEDYYPDSFGDQIKKICKYGIPLCLVLITFFAWTDNILLKSTIEIREDQLEITNNSKETWRNMTYDCWDRESSYQEDIAEYQENLTAMELELNRSIVELNTIKYIFESYCVCDCDNEAITQFLYG